MIREDFDQKYKKHLQKKIRDLKKEKDILIIAHNYQRDEIQEVADIAGDSYAMAREAMKAREKTIVFCGVLFMAESASILNPDKTILLPVREAGCPLAEMVTVEKLKKKKTEIPDAAVVCYVNSPAAVKAESDVCCTSSNAIKVIRSLKENKILFVPDRSLGLYVAERVPEKEIVLWDGFCVTHIRLTQEEVAKAKKAHPDAEFIAHPECRKEVLDLADFIGSTAAMIKYAKNSPSEEFIVGTEAGIIYRLTQDNPGKKFYVPTDQLTCANMKLTTLGWVARAMEQMKYEIKVTGEVADRARRTLERMMEISEDKK